jgi:hypothetical protein
MIGPLVFKLATPFSPVGGSESEEFRYAPVVCGYLEYDNSHSREVAELVFGIGGSADPISGPDLTGFSFGGTHGFATAVSREVELRRGAAVFGSEFAGLNALHFSVPPQSRRISPLVLGFCQSGFHYNRLFASLAAVLAHGLAEHSRYLAMADARDAEFMRSILSFEAKATSAQAVRAWLAQSRRRAGETDVDLTGLRDLCRSVTG